jgi:hypothetical protein
VRVRDFVTSDRQRACCYCATNARRSCVRTVEKQTVKYTRGVQNGVQTIYVIFIMITLHPTVGWLTDGKTLSKRRVGRVFITFVGKIPRLP